MSESIKGNCVFCGGEMVFREEDVGRVVECPHCKRSMEVEGAEEGSVELSKSEEVSPSPGLRPPSPARGEGESSVQAARQSRGWLVMVVCLIIFVVVGVGLGWMVAQRKGEAEKSSQEIARLKMEQERFKAEAEKARAEADRAKAEVELARTRLKEEEAAKEAEKARADSLAQAAERSGARDAEERARKLEEVKNRLKSAPAVWALWEEQDKSAIKIAATRPADATLLHKGESVVVKYDDMPEWLRTAVQAKHQQDGEATGLIREVNGKTYDLRASPAGWLRLPLAEVIQIVSDGYLMVDVASLRAANMQSKVFKLKHNGLMRVLNVGDRVQIVAMSAGTHTYENKRLEVTRVPVYDPGMPVGRLKDRVVPMYLPSVAAKPKGAGDPKQSGSGFFVSEDGLFVTNEHVVEEYTKIEVKVGGVTRKATVLRVDKDKDLALLQVQGASGATALRVATNNLSIGTHVFTIGFPLVDLTGTQPKFTDGKVSSVAGLRDNPDEMQISVAVQPGNSGGPLADANGDVVGVVVAQLSDFNTIAVAGSIPQNVNYAIKGTTLARFFRENAGLVRNVRMGRSAPRTQEEAIRLVERASALVLVYE